MGTASHFCEVAVFQSRTRGIRFRAPTYFWKGRLLSGVAEVPTALADFYILPFWLLKRYPLFGCQELRQATFISHEVFFKSFCKVQFPHKSVNLFFILVIAKDKWMGLWGRWLLNKDDGNTLCEINLEAIRDKLECHPLVINLKAIHL